MRRAGVRLINAALLPEQFVFVGGKGGVGKTTMAGAVSSQMAAKAGRTLVVSTDPAHSLSDAFCVPLTSTPAKIADIGEGELWGMEIDPKQALKGLEESLNIEHIRQMVESNSGTLGHGVVSVLQKQGVNVSGIVDLLHMSPPGIDEAVALAQLMRSSATGEYKRVVVDTAPTGHTLRLLSFPKFLLSSLQSVMSLQEQMFGGVRGYLFSGEVPFIKQMLGDGMGEQLKNSEEQLDKLKAAMDELEAILVDPSKTQFIVVSSPTHLATEETLRLLTTLHEQKYGVRTVVVNQVTPDCTNVVESLTRIEQQDSNKEAVQLALSLARRSQKISVQGRKEIERLQSHITDNAYGCSVVEQQYLDEPPIGVSALTMLGEKLSL